MPDLPEALLTHLAQREAARHQQAADWYATLTDRERALVRDAAVMGYVQGTYHRRDVDVFPKDSTILAMVVEECLAITNKFPAISHEEQPDA
jgi:hypothetical protein